VHPPEYSLCPRTCICVAVCCSVLPCVAVCCRVLPCIAAYCSMLQLSVAHRPERVQSLLRILSLLTYLYVYYMVLSCVAVRCSVLYHVAAASGASARESPPDPINHMFVHIMCDCVHEYHISICHAYIAFHAYHASCSCISCRA